MQILPKILQPKTTYIVDYPEAVAFAKKQNSIFWTDDEIELEKDIQDILVNMTPAEKHGVITVLKLFTKYELSVGNEYWGERVKRIFNRPDIQRMANCFSFFELNVHAPFYAKINELLHLATDEFYNSYTNDPDLVNRMNFIDESLNDSDDLFSLGVFAMIEGAILYSNFAFLKHFQSQGKNKLINLVAGINFSVRDENLHHEGGAWLFRTLLEESKLSPEAREALFAKIHLAAKTLSEHEHRICDMIFEKGRIEGITAHQLKNFVDSRIDSCLQNLGLDAQFKPQTNPIAEWFYAGISSKAVIHDFFAKLGNSYVRGWNETAFKW